MQNKNQTEISVSITRVWAQCLVRLGRGAKNRPGASTLFGKNREKVMSELQLLLKRYRELEEARAFNNWLGERRQAQEGQRHLGDVSRLTDVHRQVPQLRYAQAERRGVNGRCATVNEDTPRTASTSARASSRWWATLSGTSRCWTSRTARPPRSSQATSTWTILCSPARTPTPGPCSTRPCIPRTPAEPRERGRAPCAEVLRRNPLC